MRCPELNIGATGCDEACAPSSDYTGYHQYPGVHWRTGGQRVCHIDEDGLHSRTTANGGRAPCAPGEILQGLQGTTVQYEAWLEQRAATTEDDQRGYVTDLENWNTFLDFCEDDALQHPQQPHRDCQGHVNRY